jgi:hypothetical protein
VFDVFLIFLRFEESRNFSSNTEHSYVLLKMLDTTHTHIILGGGRKAGAVSRPYNFLAECMALGVVVR